MIKQRVITALVLAPLMLGGIFLLPATEFSYFIALIVALGAWEWANISGYQHPVLRIGYAALTVLALAALQQFPDYQIAVLGLGALWWLFSLALVWHYPNGTQYWASRPMRALFGFVVLVPMWSGFVALKSMPHSGLLIAYLMLVVWGADTGAYFAGKAFGKAKLAPHVSPGKSWAGFWGGLATTMLVLAVFALYVHHNIQSLDSSAVLRLLLITLITALASVLGDLVESMLKRQRGIKDSSALLPGHGGVLDRIDSMTAAVPVFAFLLLLLGWSLA